MLEANKNRLFEKIFYLYNRNLLRRKFKNLLVRGFENLQDQELPTLIYSNHTGWWDGLVAFHISQTAGLDSYVMMEEKHLKRLFLFSKLGAFSVIRENPRAGLESIKYAAGLLQKDRKRSVWIYPQGEILPCDRRPIIFQNGVARIIERIGRCRIICLAVRYEFLGDFKPEIFVRIDKPEDIIVNDGFNSKEQTLKMAQIMTGNLDKLKNSVLLNEIEAYRNLI